MIDLIEIFNCQEEMKRIMQKILCGTQSRLMNTMDALSILQSKYSETQARAFHHVYMIIITQGQKETKKSISKNVYYRALKAFRQTGLSLIASDGNSKGMFLERGFPADFSLEIDDNNPYYQKPLYEVPYVHNDSDSF